METEQGLLQYPIFTVPIATDKYYNNINYREINIRIIIEADNSRSNFELEFVSIRYSGGNTVIIIYIKRQNTELQILNIRTSDNGFTVLLNYITIRV